MNTIAIIGASNDPAKYGNRAVRTYKDLGWTVFPVNPKETLVENLPCYSSILDVPARPELVSVYLPPPILLRTLPDIAKKGCDELWLNPGTDTDEVVAAAEALGLNTIRACSLVAADAPSDTA